jgi:hypothetical protein
MTIHQGLRGAGRVALGLVVLVGAAGLTYRLVDRGWADRWGATDPELRTPMPGDQLVRQPIFDSTRAVTIHAPAADVWPWLVQLGVGRGGLYSYDRAEQLLGIDVRNADRILPEHQRLAVGDTIWITPQGYPAKLVFKVAEVTPERSLLLAFTEDPHSRTVPTDPGWTWSFVLQPVVPQTTRLLLRDRQTSLGNPVIDAFMGGLVGPVGFVMTRKMLEGIAERTEGLAGTGGGRSRAEPLFFWLLGLGAAGAVAVAVTPRRRWWWRLGLGTLAAGALTQVLFRGFPSPWPAGLVALGIGAAAVLSYRHPPVRHTPAPSDGHRQAPEPAPAARAGGTRHG